MLLSLKIKHLILIDDVQLSLGPGLNILTGETGAGKSILLLAIRLLIGAKGTADYIQEGKEMAVVEAEIGNSKETSEWVRKEIYRSGKSRCFMNDAQISLSQLKEWMENKIALIEQSSSHFLAFEESQRNFLDAFSEIDQELELLRTKYLAKQRLSQEIDDLENMQLSQKLAKIDQDLAFIKTVNLQEDEDLSLSNEHACLVEGQEVCEKIGIFSKELESISSILQKTLSFFDRLGSQHAKLKIASQSMKSSLIEIQEAQSSLESYLDDLSTDPHRLENVEKRIGWIEQLKKKFGSTWEEIERKKTDLLKEKIDLTQKLEQHKNLQEELDRLHIELLDLAAKIHQEREKGAKRLQAHVSLELKDLNLGLAKFMIHLTPKPLSIHGIDEVGFLFSANPGTSLAPLKDCASGGELSRVLLALTVCLSRKKAIPCLIFDEIDSNVGGQTASMLGEKLKALGENGQVIAVTHFIQVAKMAEQHFVVKKKTQQQRTTTQIFSLNSEDKEKEYLRMLGKN